ncbi:MAG: SRPBCC domain-containing protein [Chloroflexia bacterium]|nr:SRPBCC domain-containing protein [Chloroflexia bacterium]
MLRAAEGTIEIKTRVGAWPERVFAFLSRAGRLREWLCDAAWSDPIPGGRYTLLWESGYQAQGSFMEVAPPERVVMIWHGLGEPAPTLLEWKLLETPEGTEITLVHSGFGDGLYWEASYAEADKGWRSALENLVSVLEQGIDLRPARQPFLGIHLEEMNARRAESEGIASEVGIYISNVEEGSAAEAGGIQKGDVLVGLAGREIPRLRDLFVTMPRLRAGETVEAALVRGQERLALPVTLGTREQPEVPEDPEQVLADLQARRERLEAALLEATEGVGEEEASQAPSEGEWSVREVLAHLCQAERMVHQQIGYLAMGRWLEGDYDPVVGEGLQATLLQIEPTLSGLVERFRRDMQETVQWVRYLPQVTLADGYRYRQIVLFVLKLHEHTEEHIEQIRKTLAAVRAL